MELVHQAKRRGVFSVDSVPEAASKSADEIAEEVGMLFAVEVPQISTWLTVLGEHGSLSELSVVSITECDLQTCAASWRLLSRWRAYLDVILSTPLMKLQGQRDDDFDDELYDYLDEAEHLGMIWQQRCRGGESGAAGGAIPTEAAALAQRRLKKVGRAGAFLAAATPAAAKGAAASPSPAPVGALTDSEDEAPQPEEEGAVLVDGWSSKESSKEQSLDPTPMGTRGPSVTSASSSRRGSRPGSAVQFEEPSSTATQHQGPSRVNAIQNLVMTELHKWERALPLVHMLLDPVMRSAQWQRVFATVPPPKKSKLDEAGDEMVHAVHGGPVMDEEMERKRAAEEMAKLRAPNAMCLRPLWEHDLHTFGQTIERIVTITRTRGANETRVGAPMAVGTGRRDAVWSHT